MTRYASPLIFATPYAALDAALRCAYADTLSLFSPLITLSFRHIASRCRHCCFCRHYADAGAAAIAITITLLMIRCLIRR